jgi:VWFA-related protein
MRLVISAVMLGSLVWASQGPPAEDELVFRSTTQLVQFTVVAVDRDGKPVTDLRAEEFTLEDKGKKRPLAVFRFEGGPQTVPDKPREALPAGEFSNRVERAGGPPRNITAIVLDTANTDPRDAIWVRAQAVRFLRALAPETRVAVYLLGSRLTVLHDFTDDWDALRRRLQQATLALPPLTELNMNTLIAEAEALLRMHDYDPLMEKLLRAQIESDMQANAATQRQRLENTLNLIESLGRHLSAIPGRKNLIWVGGGISMLSVTGAMGFGSRGGVESYEGKVRAAAQRLAQHGVTLYNVDARGLQASAAFDSGVSGSSTPGRRRFERQQQAATLSADPLPAMFAMAEVTGGRVIQNTNDPMDGVREAVRDLRAAYTLGFYVPEEADGKWHGLKIKVSRPGVRIQHPEGYLSEAAVLPPSNWGKEQWGYAMANPLGSSAIPLDATCRLAPERGEVSVELRIDPRPFHFERKGEESVARLQIGVGEKNAEGLIGYTSLNGSMKIPAAAKTMPPPDENRFEHTWKPKEGATVVRMIVRDQTTNLFGTLDLPLKSCSAAAGS